MKYFLLELSVYEIVLLAGFAIAFFIQLFFYLFYFIRVITYRYPSLDETKTDFPPVSVVICARDEEQNLKSFLPFVLEQDYPYYEVVVVDDCSTDDTEVILEFLKRKYGHLRSTTIKQDNKFTHGKKLALTVGIKSAKYDCLLLTDADCKPFSNKWLSTMVSNFDKKTEVVLGYGSFFPAKSFLNKIIRFDTFFIALQYFGYALAGKPYMGIGRNLAYRKELFFRNKGFASHSHIYSGDDDLFVHEVANSENTRVEFRHVAHTHSNSRESFSAWFKQKKRHLTTGPHYKGSTKTMLVLEPLSRVIFWGLGIAMLPKMNLLWIVLAVMAFRLILNGIIIKIALNRLNERKIFIISLVYDLLSPLVLIVFHISNRLTPRRSKWN